MQTFALSYIGMAAAIGLSINIPVIVRSLAKDFYAHAGHEERLISLDMEFLLALDASTSNEQAGTFVDKYTLAWWKVKGPAPKKSILTSANIRMCLAFHRDQFKKSAGDPAKMMKPEYVWKPSAGDKQGNCARCRLYRAVALGVLDELQDIRHHIHGMEVSLAAKKELTMRRASGFNQVFEYLVSKELDAAATTTFFDELPLPIPAPQLHEEILLAGQQPKRASRQNKKVAGRRKTAGDVQRGAMAEVARLQNLPSLKWTWGAILEPSELRALVRSADIGEELPHSDYDFSLPFGRDTRTWSPAMSDQDFSGIYSEIGSDVVSIPDLEEDDYPHMFLDGIRAREPVFLSTLGRGASSGAVAVPRPAESSPEVLLENYMQPPRIHHGHHVGTVAEEMDIDDMYVPEDPMPAAVSIHPTSQSPSKMLEDFPGLVAQATNAFLKVGSIPAATMTSAAAAAYKDHSPGQGIHSFHLNEIWCL